MRSILLLTMLFGIAAFGQALYSYHFVAHAAREATRWASVNGANCAADSSCKAPAAQSDVQTYVSNLIPPGIDPRRSVRNRLVAYDDFRICAAANNAPGAPGARSRCRSPTASTLRFRWCRSARWRRWFEFLADTDHAPTEWPHFRWFVVQPSRDAPLDTIQSQTAGTLEKVPQAWEELADPWKDVTG